MKYLTFEEYLQNHEDVGNVYESVADFEADPLRNISIDELKAIIREVALDAICEQRDKVNEK